MQIIRDPDTQIEFTRQGWAGLGNFDGVHLGHQAVIQAARQYQHSGPVGVVTFYPHPLTVVDARRTPVPLTTLEQRIQILGTLGLDFVVVYTFDRAFASQSPQEFVQKRLIHDLGLSGVSVGRDFLFGQGRTGDPEMLRQLGQDGGLGVVVVDDLVMEGLKVSSSRIRHVLSEGMVELATRLLGRPFFVDGKVIPGDGRGRNLGFPTVNLDIQPGLFLRDGVYAGAIRIASKGLTCAAACHIGPIPTFGKRKRVLEAHIIGLDDDLYDCDVRIWFLKRLRGIKRFANEADLVRRIQQDVDNTTQVFEAQPAEALVP